MLDTRPFAYNSGSPISGTTNFGDLIVGNVDVDYSSDYGGVKWWMGPDEDLGYVIGQSVPTGQPVPIGVTGTSRVGFYRSKFKTNNSFLDLANFIARKNGHPPFATTNDAEVWLESNGYYTSFNLPTPTPTSTAQSTPTPTPTLTTTSTQTQTPTNTQTPTPSITASETPTPTPSITASQTQTPTTTSTQTSTPTPSITASQTQTPTPSITASQTQTPTPSITASQTQTPTLTPTKTPTPSITSSQTQTPTPSITASATPTPTLTRTPTPTAPSKLTVHFDISNSSSYPGSGNVITDLSGNGNTGTLNGDYSYSALNSGTMSMGGTNSYVNVPQSASINISNTSTPVSVVMWINITAGYLNGDGIWNKNFDAGSYDGYRLIAQSSNQVRLGINGASYDYNISSASNAIATGTWMMLTTIVQGGTSYVYRDNNSTPIVQGVTNAQSIPSNTANLQLCVGEFNTLGGYLPCRWGQFRYYKDKSLSTAEISALFDLDKAKYGL
jgi:hypothetical protein